MSQLLSDAGVDSDEEEMDWEEVTVPHDAGDLNLELDQDEGPSTRPNIEITISSRSGKASDTPKCVG